MSGPPEKGEPIPPPGQGRKDRLPGSLIADYTKSIDVNPAAKRADDAIQARLAIAEHSDAVDERLAWSEPISGPDVFDGGLGSLDEVTTGQFFDALRRTVFTDRKPTGKQFAEALCVALYVVGEPALLEMGMAELARGFGKTRAQFSKRARDFKRLWRGRIRLLGVKSEEYSGRCRRGQLRRGTDGAA